MRSGIPAGGASQANDVRVFLFGGHYGQPEYKSLFEALRAENMTGGRYQLLFYGSSPTRPPAIYFIEQKGYRDVLDGAMVITESCDGEHWDDFATFLGQLNRSDFPASDGWWGVRYSPTYDFARVLHAVQDGGGVVDEQIGLTVDSTVASLLMMNHVLVNLGHALHKLPNFVFDHVAGNISFPGVCGGTVSFDAEIRGQRTSVIK
eukprot:CAMPEP_0179152942 /NCGR_PEP_ID=MMETSP0796-20121207/74344_1 /TAXON_ID=73915 /ORGANISM="Pyrodinium bahamense, Strain pbaha01" /LENGTH=204 /DNA_ID=CAMNT_0020854177 /DNA_START=1 /DNA_END=612 /DNA_ORIENTATION=-